MPKDTSPRSSLTQPNQGVWERPTEKKKIQETCSEKIREARAGRDLGGV